MSNRKVLAGVVPPIVTSFTPEGKFYKKGMENLIDFVIEGGVNGLFALGSYGGFALMDTEERKKVADVILSKVDQRIPVAIQVGSPATHISVGLAKHAEASGATVVAAVPPYYYSGFAYKEDDILHFFEELVKAVNIPVWIYNNPKTTGYRASVELMTRMAEAGVAGLKDSTGDYMFLVEVIREVRKVCPDFAVTAGTAGLFQALYYQGSDACIAGTANVFPKLLSSLYTALEAGDLEQSSKLQGIVIALRKVQAVRGFRPATCYTLLRMRGVDAGTCRSPWREPEAGYVEKMRKLLDEIPEVKDLCVGKAEM